jgi:hypothetical protein
MRYFSLATQYREAAWFLNPLTGALHQANAGDVHKFQTKQLPTKVLQALEYCDTPFSLAPPDINQRHALRPHQTQTLKKIYDRVLSIRQINYWLVKQYASLHRPIFEDSLQAFHALKELNISVQTDYKGCLNRTLAVAKTSVRFKKSGVLFIGADLPLNNLHAWIIEENYQADPWDRDWINYMPLAAYAYA